ncbi:MAG: iron-containing alcohol dehydrogenase [Rectinemataceae bacterium]
MQGFEFATASRVRFGRGAVGEAGKAAAAFGRRAVVVCGSDPAGAAFLLDLLRVEGVEAYAQPVRGEPSFGAVLRALEAARSFRAELVIGIGGGSVLDSAKALAALFANPGEILDYAEVIGSGRPLSAPSLPCIAVPTTAGTGSEVTRNAVLLSEEHAVKVSLRSPTMLPRLAIVDPELCLGLPPDVTASTGMDAMTQLIEPFVSNRANPLTDALCRDGIARAAGALPRAFENGRDLEAREDMSLAALFGGFALANARLGAVHGFAAPIGGAFRAPHGAICAAILPAVVAVNLRALRARDASNAALARYAEIAALVTGAKDAEAEVGAEALSRLASGLGIRGLGTWGIGAGDFPLLIERAKAASSMQGNPIRLEDDELAEILELSL